MTLATETYQFKIANDGVDHEVRFALDPKEKYEAANHIKVGYVKTPMATEKSSLTSFFNLAAGEYEYFCPLNPIDKYGLPVK